jgi:hypothetical protein
MLGASPRHTLIPSVPLASDPSLVDNSSPRSLAGIICVFVKIKLILKFDLLIASRGEIK